MQPPPAQNEKEEGPAEEAPEENRPTDLEPLSGYADQNKKKMQIFELNGYLRLRDDYMHDFFLGLGYSTVPSGSTAPGTTNYGLPPFPVPLDCPSPANSTGVADLAGDRRQPRPELRDTRTSAAPTSVSAWSRR